VLNRHFSRPVMSANPHNSPPPAAQGRLGRRIQAVAYPAATFAALLIAWELLVQVFRVPEYILPVPTDFLARFVEARQLLWTHTLVTSQEILMGFGAATVISVPLALLIVSVPLLERCIYPVIVFFQLVPKIAIAPLFIVWFGFGLFPKVLLTFLLCFFPILVDSMTGFRALDERLLYITRSMGATRWQTFRYVRLPAAMPFIFSGLKISIVLAATGAIVGEFVGANSGLGYLLLRGSSYLDMTLIFAVLVALSAVGLLFSYAVQASERLVMPWQYKS
jgi:NitT/TauT family transport system permease protein